MSPILNACNTPLSANSGTLPNVSGAMMDYFQRITFIQIVKTIVNFKVVETPTSIDFLGVWQLLSARQISMKPEGQRSWKWFSVHCEPTLILNVDDAVIYLGTQYRVKGVSDYSLYGYFEYHLIEDYQGSGPS